MWEFLCGLLLSMLSMMLYDVWFTEYTLESVVLVSFLIGMVVCFLVRIGVFGCVGDSIADIFDSLN